MYTIFRNNLGQIDAINIQSTGESLVFDPITKTFDESHPNTIALRSWEQEHGKLDLSDRPVDPYAERYPLGLTLEQAKAQKKPEIIAIAIAKQEELVAGFAPPEQASWSRKVTEAKAFLASLKIEDAPMLKAEAIALSNAKNDTVILQYTKGLASKILAKSEAMYLDSAIIAGTRTRLLAQIEAAQTIEELNVIVWS